MVRSRFSYKNIKNTTQLFINVFNKKPKYFFVDFNISCSLKPQDFLNIKYLRKLFLKRSFFCKNNFFLKQLFLKKIFKNNFSATSLIFF